MPGLDQRGPSGQGAMTGRGQGSCRNRGQGETAGGFGGRGRRRGCRGRGFGRGDAAPAQFTEPSQAELEDRAKALEDELNAVKRRLNTMSDRD